MSGRVEITCLHAQGPGIKLQSKEWREGGKERRREGRREEENRWIGDMMFI